MSSEESFLDERVRTEHKYIAETDETQFSSRKEALIHEAVWEVINNRLPTYTSQGITVCEVADLVKLFPIMAGEFQRYANSIMKGDYDEGP